MRLELNSPRILAILIIFGILITDAVAQNRPKSYEQVILERLLDGGVYDHRFRPVNSQNLSAPVEVAVNIFIRIVDKVDDINQELNVQLTFRQEWKDERLSFTPPSGADNWVTLINPQNQIWIPDTFFSNEKASNFHNVLMRNEFVRIFSNGNVLYSSRLSMRLSCPMNFRRFPLDRQKCSIRLAGYGRTIHEVNYSWKKDEPIQTRDNLVMPGFSYDGFETSHCDAQTNTGRYSCLLVEFTLHRQFKPFLIHVYIPSTMMVLVSWTSFWISVRAMAARMVLVISALFVLATQVAQINQTFPRTGYTKAVDTWTGICLTFVFAVLLEFCTVHFCTRRLDERNAARTGTDTGTPEIEATRAHGDDEEVPLKELNQAGSRVTGVQSNMPRRAGNALQRIIADIQDRPKKLDIISRIAFPVMFLLFNILYWSITASG